MYISPLALNYNTKNTETQHQYKTINVFAISLLAIISAAISSSAFACRYLGKRINFSKPRSFPSAKTSFSFLFF